MSKVCPVTGKRPLTGNRVSHANNKTRRIFEPNMQSKLRISAKGLKIIDKLGVDPVLAQMKAKGVQF